MKIKITLMLILLFFLNGCGKVGPLALSEDKLDKSVITYPCDEACMEKFETEKLRQKSVTIQVD
jgi:predicted small lipoprotein YifL